MRKTIRLTGRRQLAQNAFEFRFSEINGQNAAILAIVDSESVKSFPLDARIRVKLSENKLVRILDFGTIGHPTTVANVDSDTFRAPSCQIRIVNSTGDKSGMLLGSTRTWTLASSGEPDGILLFQPAPIAPRLWSLDTTSQDQPVLYIDETIPRAAQWAKSDPTFAACVLPAVIAELMQAILDLSGAPEEGWEADWLQWADGFMPGSIPPYKGTTAERKRWIDDLIDAFAASHNLSGNVVTHIMAREEEKS